MQKLTLLVVLFIFFAGVISDVQAQADIGIKPNFAGGEVLSVTDTKFALKTLDGDIEVNVSNSTIYKRIPPENPTLKAAVDSSVSEIGIGDKILVTGMVSNDKKTIPAKVIYLITKSDIAARQAKETMEWSTRGITGKVASVDRLSKAITITTRSLVGETKTVITPKENIRYHRYAQDSVKFSEARESVLGEISTGDMIRALGDKGQNNTFQAEIIVTGAFQTTAGTVTAIDIEKSEVTVSDFQSKKPVTVVVGKTTILKEFPAELAQRMAMMQMMAAGGQMPQGGGQGSGQGGNPPTRPNPGSTGQGDGRPAQAGGRGMGGGSIDDMLDRFPTITVDNLKIGDMIAVSSSKATDSGRITAIKLLSGVEPFLKVPQIASGRGGRSGGQGGQDSGLSIPGLDGGFGVP